MAGVEAGGLKARQARRSLSDNVVRGWFSVTMAIALAVALVLVPAGRTQSGNGTGTGQNTIRPPYAPRTDLGTLAGDDYDPMMNQRRLRMLNTERQKELVTDTNKLLKLARELNAEVASQKSEALTPEQLHKIAEIEKLAHSVKERMTAAVGAPQSTFPPPVVYPLMH